MRAARPADPVQALRAGLRWLQAPVAVVALLFCLRGEGKVDYWLALLGSVPALRLATDPNHRRRVRAARAALWAAAGAYARGGPLPWRAALAFVVLPAGVLFLSTNRTVGSGDSWPVMTTACSLLTD